MTWDIKVNAKEKKFKIRNNTNSYYNYETLITLYMQ